MSRILNGPTIMIIILALITTVILGPESQVEGNDPYENNPPRIYHANVRFPVSHHDEYNFVEFLVDDDRTRTNNLTMEVMLRDHDSRDPWIRFDEHRIDEQWRRVYYDLTMDESFTLGWYDLKYRISDTDGYTTNWTEEERVIYLAKENITIEQVVFSGTHFNETETLNIKIYAYHEWLDHGYLWYKVETFPDTFIHQNKLGHNASKPYLEVNWTFDNRFAHEGIAWDFKITIWDGLGAMEYYENLDNITVYDPPAVVWDWKVDLNPVYRGDNLTGSFWISDEDDDVSQNGISLYLTYIGEEGGHSKGYYNYGAPNIRRQTGELHERFVEFYFQTDRMWTPGPYQLRISYWGIQRIDFEEEIMVLNNPPMIIENLSRLKVDGWESIILEEHIQDRENGRMLHWEYNITEGEELVKCKIFKNDLTWYLQISSKWNVSGNATVRISGTDSEGATGHMDVVVEVNTLVPIRDDTDDDDDDTGGTTKGKTPAEKLILGSVIGLIIIAFIIALALFGVLIFLTRKYKQERIQKDSTSTEDERKPSEERVITPLQ